MPPQQKSKGSGNKNRNHIAKPFQVKQEVRHNTPSPSTSSTHIAEYTEQNEQPRTNAITTPLRTDFDQKVRPFIDLIDKLRAFGLDEDVNLPAVAVIGDQSAGKSSTLEAISGIQLPRGSGIVTRCPLVLRLKSTPTDGIWIARISYTDQDGEKHTRTITTPEQVGEEVLRAQTLIAGDDKGISKDLITLDVESNEVPDLTLIDLPGITRVAVEGQPENIPEQIKRLITERITNQETIILAVIPANIDIATTEALQIAKLHDPDGERTLGVITKPDLIDKGTENELIAVLSNNRCPLVKGYTAVKCRGQQKVTSGQTLAEALQAEREFFENEAHFKDVDKSLLGIRNLSKKLSHELVEQIKKTVPKLKEEVSVKIKETKHKLEQIGRGLPEDKTQRTFFLVELLTKFGDKMRELCQGEYRELDHKSEHRLFTHARVCFKELMEAIAEETPSSNDQSFIRKIMEENEQYRGNELPRFMNYKVCQNLIKGIIAKYRRHADACLAVIDQMVDTTIVDVAQDEFQQFPALCGEVKCKINQLRNEATECCKDRITEIFDMEQLVFTQDRIYNHDLDVVKEKQRRDEEGADHHLTPQSAKQVVSNLYEGIADRLEKLTFGYQVTDTEHDTVDHAMKKKEAEDMYNMIKAYLEVSARRMVDIIPLMIQLHLFKRLSEKIRLEITAMVAEPETVDLIREEESVVEDRNMLQHKLERLELAENELFRV